MDGVFTFFKSIGYVFLVILIGTLGFGVLGLLYGVVKIFFKEISSKFGIRIFEKSVSENSIKLSKLITELYGYEVDGVPEIDKDVEGKVLDDLYYELPKEIKIMLHDNDIKPGDDIFYKLLYETLMTKVKIEKTIDGKVKYSVDNVDDYY